MDNSTPTAQAPQESTMFSGALPQLQVAWDNTSLSIYKECPRKYYYAIVQGWRPKTVAAPLEFGKAYHDCLETYDALRATGLTQIDALGAAIRKAFTLSENWPDFDDNARTRITLIRSIIWYSEEYTHDEMVLYRLPDGNLGLELSFRFGLGFSSPSGEEYLYCWHMDKLALYGGQLYTVERKHTKLTLSSSYFEKYFFSAQITGYVYSGRVVLHEKIAGAIVEATQVGVNFSRFGRAAINRVEDHLEEWRHDLQFWIRQAEECATKSYWPHNSESCGKYSGCQFRRVCAKSPALRQVTLEYDFKQDRWDPTINRGTD